MDAHTRCQELESTRLLPRPRPALLSAFLSLVLPPGLHPWRRCCQAGPELGVGGGVRDTKPCPAHHPVRATLSGPPWRQEGPGLGNQVYRSPPRAWL